MTWRRLRAPGAAGGTVAFGPGIVLLIAIAVIGVADAARGEAPAPEQVEGAPPAARVPACSNLEDDDKDGLTDLEDPNCSGPMDEQEELDPPRRPPPTPDQPPTPDPSPAPDPPATPEPPATSEPPPTPAPPPAPELPSLPSPPSSIPAGGAKDATGRSHGSGKRKPGGNAGGGGGVGREDGGGSGRHEGHRDGGGDGNGGTPASSGQSRKPVRGRSIRAPKRTARKTAPTHTADLGTPPVGVSGLTVDAFEIPTFLLPLYRDCASRYGLRWQVLAAINKVETAFGTNLNVSTAGAVGWMQFMPSSWAAYGVDADGDGDRDPYDPHDAICSAANYLRAAGAPGDMRGAVFAYNHADWYVDLVLGIARQYDSVYLPEPLPRAKRLDRDFARRLVRISRRHDVGWALVLAILRVRGDRGRTPASADEVRAVARRVAQARRGVRAQRPARAQRRARPVRLGAIARSLFEKRAAELKVAAMTRYNRAVGLHGLVGGLHSVGDRLRRRVLESDRILLYTGGRDDVRAGRIDPLVLTLLLYLAERYDKVTITSLVSGHGYFARPGVPSMHVFGRAVDVAAVGGTPILGHQQPGGVTEDALRDILLLPDELQPAQVISLFDLGGPSFAAADHDDHIHVGF